MVDYEEIFNLSYWRVIDRSVDGVAFLDRFYYNFIKSSPDIPPYFAHTDMAVQKDMLRMSLVEMSRFFVNRTADAHIERVARIHSLHDRAVMPHLYDQWLRSLIATVRQYDPEFGDDVELAWRMVLSSGMTYMKFKYDH